MMPRCRGVVSRSNLAGQPEVYTRGNGRGCKTSAPFSFPRLSETLDGGTQASICALDHFIPTALDIFPCSFFSGAAFSVAATSGRAGGSSYLASGSCAVAGAVDLVRANFLVGEVIIEILGIGVRHGRWVEVGA